MQTKRRDMKPPHFLGRVGRWEKVMGLAGAAAAAASAAAAAAAAARCEGGWVNVCTGLPAMALAAAAAEGLGLRRAERSGRPSTRFTAGSLSSIDCPSEKMLLAAWGGCEAGAGGEQGWQVPVRGRRWSKRMQHGARAGACQPGAASAGWQQQAPAAAGGSRLTRPVHED